MATRIVEGKKPYTGGKAISIDEDKVISLNLRDENNLIIYDEGDDEIYVDLQLPDGITPTDAFPVGVTTGRAVVADGWDKAGTIICAKTTSGDNIKLLYADDGTLWIDNGTGTFKQIYFKADVDALLLALRNYIDGELAKKQNGVVGATAPSNPSEGDLWYDTTNSAMKVWDGTAWQSVGTGGGGSDIVYATQAEYNALLPGAESDGKHYFIYTESGGGGWDMNNRALAQTSSALSGTWRGGVALNPNGTKIYMAHSGTSRVYECDLSTAYDISSLSFNKYISATGVEDIHFSPDGVYLYTYSPNSYLYRYTLSTPRDISTATQDQTLSGATDNRGLYISPDGTKVFISNHGGERIKRWILSTPRDLTSADSGTIVTTAYGGIGIRFSPDGKMFFTQNNEYTTDLTYMDLSTARDLSTATLSGTKNIGKCRAGGLRFDANGTICVMIGGGTSTNYVTKYTL